MASDKFLGGVVSVKTFNMGKKDNFWPITAMVNSIPGYKTFIGTMPPISKENQKILAELTGLNWQYYYRRGNKYFFRKGREKITFVTDDLTYKNMKRGYYSALVQRKDGAKMYL